MPSRVRTRISASAGVLGLVLVTAACSTSTNNQAAPTASSSGVQKLLKILRDRSLKAPRFSPPLSGKPSSVEGVVGQDQSRPLFFRDPALHEIQIDLFISAINFVAHNRMSDMRKMNPDLMFSAGLWGDLEKGELSV